MGDFKVCQVYIPLPEGVSVATVIIDGVDVAPAGVVKRSSYFRVPRVRPVDTTIRAPWMAKQPQRQTLETVRPRALQDQPRGKNRRKSVDARISRHSRTTTTGILARACVHATLRFFLYPENGITVSPRAKLCPVLIEK